MRFCQLMNYGRVAIVGMGLHVLSPASLAQIPEGLQSLAVRCTAPGGADLPECQAAKTTLEQSRNPSELTDSATVPLVRTGPAAAPALPPAAERPLLPADGRLLPTEAPT